MHTILKKIFTKINIVIFTSFIVTTLVSVHGYFNYEDFIDNKKLEIETSFANQEEKIIDHNTTTIPILVYHKIGKVLLSPVNNKPLKAFTVSQDIFEEQIQFIKSEGYTPLTMQDLIRDKQNQTLPPKPIAITFDDGWRSQYENALPILVKNNIPATFYIYTGVIGGKAYMTWDNLHELVADNMEIGDHTKNHPRLTKIAPEKLDEELLQSKIILERDLHVKVTDFAYPYGNYNDNIIKELKQYGYISARTSNKGLYNDFKDLYQLNVLYAPNNLETFKKLLSK